MRKKSEILDISTEHAPAGAAWGSRWGWGRLCEDPLGDEPQRLARDLPALCFPQFRTSNIWRAPGQVSWALLAMASGPLRWHSCHCCEWPTPLLARGTPTVICASPAHPLLPKRAHPRRSRAVPTNDPRSRRTASGTSRWTDLVPRSGGHVPADVTWTRDRTFHQAGADRHPLIGVI